MWNAQTIGALAAAAVAVITAVTGLVAMILHARNPDAHATSAAPTQPGPSTTGPPGQR